MVRETRQRAPWQIATMDQLEGLEPEHENWGDTAETGGDEGDGDPPRIWIPNQMCPGCAFTRSIGDSVGEKVGVFAEARRCPPSFHARTAPQGAPCSPSIRLSRA